MVPLSTLTGVGASFSLLESVSRFYTINLSTGQEETNERRAEDESTHVNVENCSISSCRQEKTRRARARRLGALRKERRGQYRNSESNLLDDAFLFFRMGFAAKLLLEASSKRVQAGFSWKLKGGGNPYILFAKIQRGVEKT